MTTTNTTIDVCGNPACDQPGTNKCSACKATPYCGPICQTADWPRHKEECPGHLRKVGMAHLEKAKGFDRANNWPQMLRYSDLAATKLKQMEDRPVEDISDALNFKFNALNMMGRYRESMECAKEWYCLWLTKHTHPRAIVAGFALIESCIHNKEFADALLYSHTTWETLTLSRDSHIPEHQRQQYTANGAMLFSKSTFYLAQSGGIPAEEMQKAGQEAIMLARSALEIHTQVHGHGSEEVANDLSLLAGAVGLFEDVDDDEIPRLYEKAKAIFTRVQGSLSRNVAACEKNWGAAYSARAAKAQAANDLDREIANLELALPRLREAARIYRIANRMESANDAALGVVRMEEQLRQAIAAKAAATRG